MTLPERILLTAWLATFLTFAAVVAFQLLGTL